MYTPIPPKKRGHYGNNLWDAYSPKLQRMINLYSDLERDNWVLIEMDPSVKTFCEQPLKVAISIDGNIVKTIFDMWVQWRDNTEGFIEVKYSTSLLPESPDYEKVKKQTSAQQKWCTQKGVLYEIRTEEIIRANRLYLANLKRILSFIRNRKHPIETDCHQIVRVLQHKGKMKAEELELHLLNNMSRTRLYEGLSWLYYQMEILLNLEQQAFGHEMEVSLHCQEGG